MTATLLLAHGDDAFAIAQAVAQLAASLGDADRIDLAPERSPDEGILDRAGVEAASVGLFGAHLVVLHQPLRAAGRSLSGEEKLLGMVRTLPDGAALAFALARGDELSHALELAARAGAAVLTGRGPYTSQLAFHR